MCAYVPNLPEPAELRACKREIRSEFVSASRRGAKAFAYITAPEQPGAKFEDFLVVEQEWEACNRHHTEVED